MATAALLGVPGMDPFMCTVDFGVGGTEATGVAVLAGVAGAGVAGAGVEAAGVAGAGVLSAAGVVGAGVRGAGVEGASWN